MIPDLKDLTLTVGMHNTRDDGVCAMEAVAWLAGEPHTDAPACIPTPLAKAFQVLNDWGWESDQERTAALRPHIARLLELRDAPGAPRLAYALAAADFAVRTVLPVAFDAAGLTHTLGELPPVVAGNAATAAHAVDTYATVAHVAIDAHTYIDAYATASCTASAIYACTASRAVHAVIRAAHAVVHTKTPAGDLLSHLLDVHEAGVWPLPE